MDTDTKPEVLRSGGEHEGIVPSASNRLKKGADDVVAEKEEEGEQQQRFGRDEPRTQDDEETTEKDSERAKRKEKPLELRAESDHDGPEGELKLRPGCVTEERGQIAVSHTEGEDGIGKDVKQEEEGEEDWTGGAAWPELKGEERRVEEEEVREKRGVEEVQELGEEEEVVGEKRDRGVPMIGGIEIAEWEEGGEDENRRHHAEGEEEEEEEGSGESRAEVEALAAEVLEAVGGAERRLRERRRDGLETGERGEGEMGGRGEEEKKKKREGEWPVGPDWDDLSAQREEERGGGESGVGERRQGLGSADAGGAGGKIPRIGGIELSEWEEEEEGGGSMLKGQEDWDQRGTEGGVDLLGGRKTVGVETPEEHVVGDAGLRLREEMVFGEGRPKAEAREGSSSELRLRKKSDTVMSKSDAVMSSHAQGASRRGNMHDDDDDDDGKMQGGGLELKSAEDPEDDVSGGSKSFKKEGETHMQSKIKQLESSLGDHLRTMEDIRTRYAVDEDNVETADNDAWGSEVGSRREKEEGERADEERGLGEEDDDEKRGLKEEFEESLVEARRMLGRKEISEEVFAELKAMLWEQWKAGRGEEKEEEEEDEGRERGDGNVHWGASEIEIEKGGASSGLGMRDGGAKLKDGGSGIGHGGMGVRSVSWGVDESLDDDRDEGEGKEDKISEGDAVVKTAERPSVAQEERRRQQYEEGGHGGPEAKAEEDARRRGARDDDQELGPESIGRAVEAEVTGTTERGVSSLEVGDEDDWDEALEGGDTTAISDDPEWLRSGSPGASVTVPETAAQLEARARPVNADRQWHGGRSRQPADHKGHVAPWTDAAPPDLNHVGAGGASSGHVGAGGGHVGVEDGDGAGLVLPTVAELEGQRVRGFISAEEFEVMREVVTSMAATS